MKNSNFNIESIFPQGGGNFEIAITAPEGYTIDGAEEIWGETTFKDVAISKDANGMDQDEACVFLVRIKDTGATNPISNIMTSQAEDTQLGDAANYGVMILEYTENGKKGRIVKRTAKRLTDPFLPNK